MFSLINKFITITNIVELEEFGEKSRSNSAYASLKYTKHPKKGSP